MQRHIQLLQMGDLHKYRIELLSVVKRGLLAQGEELNKVELSKVNSDIDGIFIYAQKFIADDAVLFEKINELESEIISKAYESIYYFKKHHATQLKRSVKEMIEWFESSELDTQSYRTIKDYTEFSRYQDQKFKENLGVAYGKLRLKQEHYVEFFSEILSEQ